MTQLLYRKRLINFKGEGVTFYEESVTGALDGVVHKGADLGQFSLSWRLCPPVLRFPFLFHENLPGDC